MSTILPLDIAAVLDGVVYLVIHVINQIMNGWKLTKNVLYFIKYVTLKYNHIEYQSFTYWCKLFYFYFTVICIPIKSHQSNQTRSTTLRRFISCQYSSYFLFTFYDLQYMYIYTLCCVRTIEAKYSNSTTKKKNLYYSDHTYQYSVIGQDWGHSFIESTFKQCICK